ncbi:MAG: metallophosphoesterase [Actinomycetota bacterium]
MIARLLLVVGMAFSLWRLASPVVFDLDSTNLSVKLRPAIPGGAVILSLGPLGELSWKTHKGPLNVEASFVLSPSLASPPDFSRLSDLRWSFLVNKVPWLLLLGGLTGALVLAGNSRKSVLAATGVGAASFLAAFALVVGISVLTFSSKALQGPRYRGPIEDMPRVIQLAKDVQRDWKDVRRNINQVVAGLQRIHSEILAGTAPPSENTIRLLLISDVHNNPVGLVMAQELVRQLDVKAVLDAGDFTDRGTQIEAELFARFGDLGLPHVLVAGNHEDTAALARVKGIPKITVLESRTTDHVEVEGISVLGDADPNAYFIDPDPNNETALKEIPVGCERLRSRFAAVRPQILLVHNQKLGACAAELAEEEKLPLVFAWGHAHRQAYEEHGSVVSVSPGTSGGNGLTAAKRASYGFALLEFDPETKSLVSTCMFKLDSPSELREVSCHMRSEESPLSR